MLPLLPGGGTLPGGLIGPHCAPQEIQQVHEALRLLEQRPTSVGVGQPLGLDPLEPLTPILPPPPHLFPQSYGGPATPWSVRDELPALDDTGPEDYMRGYLEGAPCFLGFCPRALRLLFFPPHEHGILR